MVLEGVSVVGFDLDGTLYKSTSEMDDRVRTQIAERLLDRDASLGDVAGARAFFENRYAELHTGGAVLREAGYENASAVMDGCLANAEVVDLIKPDPELGAIMKDLNNKYTTYLLTSSPKDLSLSKLEKIGLEGVFDFMFFGDNPAGLSKMEGTAFDYAIEKIGKNVRWHAYVGDREKSDILPANERGIASVAVWNDITEADYFIEDIKDIGELLL